MTEPKSKEWRVVSPFGIMWRPKFSTERAAWNRIMNYEIGFRTGGNFDLLRAHLKDEGWKVYQDADSG